MSDHVPPAPKRQQGPPTRVAASDSRRSLRDARGSLLLTPRDGLPQRQSRDDVRIRVDALPEKELRAELDWISPIAAIAWRGMGLTEKTFPARATLQNLDPRLRPGMSGSADIIIESAANAIMIPARASFVNKGKPAVWVQRGAGYEIRRIEVGKRNETDMVVLSGLREGETVYLENPIEAAKRAKKL